ncbi:MAG: hypothetical protein ISS15_11805 [Alphaproteobacteria bacterium]|nr:hypothetical protein [Alphaproteobacteria bacterium]MBL7098336.1 hypothetical protein [Alphaproteobacteria bacterium]
MIVGIALIIIIVAVPIVGAFLAQQAEADQALALLEGYRTRIASEASLRAAAGAAARQEADANMMVAGASPSLAAAAVQNRVLDIVQRHGGQVRSSQVLASKAAKDLVRIALQYEVSLPAGGLMGATYELETGKPFLFIDAAEIRPELYRDASAGAPATLHVSWTVHAYQKASAP